MRSYESYEAQYHFSTDARKRERAPYLIENLMWLDKIQDKPCEDCGNNFPRVCMDFHHINEKEKHPVLKKIAGFTIRKMATSGYGIKTLKAEVNKCAMICANCHRIRHHHKDKSHEEENRLPTLETFFKTAERIDHDFPEYSIKSQ